MAKLKNGGHPGTPASATPGFYGAELAAYNTMVSSGVRPDLAASTIKAVAHQHAEEIRYETSQLKLHGVLAEGADRTAASAADQLDPFTRRRYRVVLPLEDDDRFDRNPAAIAWARRKIQHAVDFAVKGAGAASLPVDRRRSWEFTARFMTDRLLGRDGCVIAAFDVRRPAVMLQRDYGLEAETP